MGSRGPQKTPTVLNVAKGNPGQRPLNKQEPKPPAPAKIPRPPKELGPLARKEWRRMSQVLYKLGLLTEVDFLQFQLYCEAFQDWVEARQELKKAGTTCLNKTGNPVVSPEQKVYWQCMDRLNRMLQAFGMSPASRSSIKAVPPEDAKDPMQRWRDKMQEKILNKQKQSNGE